MPNNTVDVLRTLPVPEMVGLVGLVITVAATVYAVLAWRLKARVVGTALRFAKPPRVSLLKPLYGFEPRLEENLASLARAAQGIDAEILCGVRDPNDAALAVVARVARAHPEVLIRSIVDTRVHGSNLKVSNLINLFAQATGEIIVIADSDILVPRTYVGQVIAPLADPAIGLVTCLYRGRPDGTLLSRIGSLFIDTWFVPSVRVASHLGERSFGFGATLALRRDTLLAIGGFEAVKNLLADDYWLGELTHRAGQITVLSDVVVDTDVVEPTFARLWARELRWMRTIRSLNPIGFAATFITHTLPMLALGVALDPSPTCWVIAALGLLARIGLQRRATARALWLMPLRDSLSLLEWACALVGSTVTWRDATMALREPSPPVPASLPLPDEAEVSLEDFA